MDGGGVFCEVGAGGGRAVVQSGGMGRHAYKRDVLRGRFAEGDSTRRRSLPGGKGDSEERKQGVGALERLASQVRQLGVEGGHRLVVTEQDQVMDPSIRRALYEEDIQKVAARGVDDISIVERVLRWEGNKALVRWRGWPHKYDGWVEKKSPVRRLREKTD